MDLNLRARPGPCGLQPPQVRSRQPEQPLWLEFTKNDSRSGRSNQAAIAPPLGRAGKEPVDWPDFPVPLLIVEVLSPSTARYDRVTKRRRYQRSQVHQYWIIDLDARVIERWRPADDRPELVTGLITWQPVPEAPALAIDLDAYFAKVWI